MHDLRTRISGTLSRRLADPRTRNWKDLCTGMFQKTYRIPVSSQDPCTNKDHRISAQGSVKKNAGPLPKHPPNEPRRSLHTKCSN